MAVTMTLEIDPVLLAEAKALTGLTDTSALVREALTVLVQRESARRLASMAANQPDLEVPSRRR